MKILPGSMGSFTEAIGIAPWYKQQQAEAESTATKLGSKSVEMKRAVAINIRNYTAGGGFLFTMCSGTDSYDIALASQNTDICDYMFDGDPPSPNAQMNLVQRNFRF